MDVREVSKAANWDRLLVTLVCALAAYLVVQLVLFHQGRDQGIYATVAHEIRAGGMPYREAWDFKPPGIFFVYLAAELLFGRGPYAARLLEALSLAATVGALMLLSRRHTGSNLAGVLSSGLAVLVHVQLGFWHTGQPESFAVPALAWALVCATAEVETASRRKRMLVWGLSGALFAWAAILKPPLGGGALSSAALVAAGRWRNRRRSGAVLEVIQDFFLGGVIVVGAVALFFVIGGAWNELADAMFEFAPGYVSLDPGGGGFVRLLLRVLKTTVAAPSAAILFGLAMFVALPPAHAREGAGALHITGCLAFQSLGVALQGKLFDYHYGAMLPLVAVLAGWGVWKLWLRTPSGLPAFGVLLLMTVLISDTHRGTPFFWRQSLLRLVALAAPAQRASINDRLYTIYDSDAGSNRRVASWIRERTEVDGRILVWGVEPTIYVLADRRPASRYFYNLPLRADWWTDRARPQFLHELEETRPSVVVLIQNDRLPHVLGHFRDSLEELTVFPELRSYLGGYVEVLKDGDLTILERRPAP